MNMKAKNKQYLAMLLKLFSIFAVVLINISVKARWMEYEDSAIDQKIYNKEIIVNENGSYESIIEFKATILKEAARDYFANYTMIYNDDTSDIKIIEAKTIAKDKEYIVDKDLIEDKPLASTGQGFDRHNQITITFPQVEIGTTIYLKYRLIQHTPVNKNIFAKILYFGSSGYWQSSKVKISSKIPLHIKINDPKQVLTVIKDKNDNFSSAEIILKKPFTDETINEPQYIIPHQSLTWVSISSLDKWQDLAIEHTKDYEKVINQELPLLFLDIIKNVQDKDNDEEKINAVTSLLNEKIQYRGDWRSVNGRYSPRDLKKIAATKIGDCKDFSASTAAILRNLGYKAQAVLVTRGDINRSPIGILPDIDYFNHAMVKVTNKYNKMFWIDPTNVQSMAGGIFPDIADRLALVLNSIEPSFEKLPAVSFEHSRMLTERNLVINNKIVNEKGTISFQGEIAAPFYGCTLYASEKTIKDTIFSQLCGTHLNEENKKNMNLPDLSSRIVKDFSIDYEYNQTNILRKSNLGNILKLEWDRTFYTNIVNTAPDQLSDVFIGVPITENKTTIIKNLKIKNIHVLDYEIDSPWLYIKQISKHIDDDTVIHTKIIVRKSLISNLEIKTKAYKTLKEQIEYNFNDVSIVLTE